MCPSLRILGEQRPQGCAKAGTKARVTGLALIVVRAGPFPPRGGACARGAQQLEGGVVAQQRAHLLADLRRIQHLRRNLGLFRLLCLPSSLPCHTACDSGRIKTGSGGSALPQQHSTLITQNWCFQCHHNQPCTDKLDSCAELYISSSCCVLLPFLGPGRLACGHLRFDETCRL